MVSFNIFDVPFGIFSDFSAPYCFGNSEDSFSTQKSLERVFIAATSVSLRTVLFLGNWDNKQYFHNYFHSNSSDEFVGFSFQQYVLRKIHSVVFRNSQNTSQKHFTNFTSDFGACCNWVYPSSRRINWCSVYQQTNGLVFTKQKLYTVYTNSYSHWFKKSEIIYLSAQENAMAHLIVLQTFHGASTEMFPSISLFKTHILNSVEELFWSDWTI